MNQWFRLTHTTGKQTLPAKMNTIDNQPLKYQNIGKHRQQTGKSCKAVNQFQDDK
jgi:hypothetical protein